MESIMPRVINMVLSTKDLEAKVERLNRRFEGLDLKGLPEYQQAVDALDRYREAAIKYFETEYAKRHSNDRA